MACGCPAPAQQVLFGLCVALLLDASCGRLGGVGQGASALARSVNGSQPGRSHISPSAAASALATVVGNDSGAVARHLATKLPSNLALYMPVTLSSVASFLDNQGEEVAGDGWRITDGDTGQRFFRDGGCAETKNQGDAWMRIDFLREVPFAVVNLYTRTDSSEPGLGPISIYVGINAQSWRDNLPCAEGVMMTRGSPTSTTCLGSGRYMFIVLRRRGTQSRRLSLCEVEVVPKGPLGTLHVLQTAGEMWDLKLEGLAMSPGDRIRIVKDTIWCGGLWSSYMDETVLSLTAPFGERFDGGYTEERWLNLMITRMGVYKVCWCGAVHDCSKDEHFSMEVARIIINGVMTTVAGNGDGAETLDYPNYLYNGGVATEMPLRDPYGVAVSNGRAFVSERRGNRIRYVEMDTGRIHNLCGHGRDGFGGGDYGPAKDAELWNPRGIGLSVDMQTLYVADSRNHRIRAIRLSVNSEGLLGDGIITTVAGSGFMGFSGDGLAAVDAQLNTPSCVQQDLNNMLWICDTGNNRIRVVALGQEVRIPGTNEFASNIILTAAGTGLNGLIGDRGDGGPTAQAQVGGPLAMAVSAGYVNAELGTLPASVYVTEEATHTVRAIGLDLNSFLGVISAFVGTDARCDSPPCRNLVEGTASTAVNAQLEAPSGIAAQDGLVYISDTRNNRILLAPHMEYMSIGCWRENTEQPWIPSIEPEDEGVDKFLDGPPEIRSDAIRKCAFAALSRGYPVFAVRRMGACASGPQAHIQYMNEGESTSCANGLGGARDNSVYRFVREGGMVEQTGLVYMLSGRESTAGFAGDGGTAWVAQLDGPTGIAVNPHNKDVYIADTNNNRLRMIFNMIGPQSGHSVRCTNGKECKVPLNGNGLQPGNFLAVTPLEKQCGEEGIDFSTGFERNPVTEIPSPSFTMKTYNVGMPYVPMAGSYRLCYCIKDSVLFGKTIACGNPEDFVMDAGVVHVSGPDATVPVKARAGVPFHLPVYGLLLSQFDRIRIVSSSLVCGAPGSELTVDAVDNSSKEDVNYQRSTGNSTWCLWNNVTINVAGQYKVCWCQGMLGNGGLAPCNSSSEFRFTATLLDIAGPDYHVAKPIMSYQGVELTVKGHGLGGGDRIRIVDTNVECGKVGASIFSRAVDPGGRVPSGQAARLSSSEAIWTHLRIRMKRRLRVCWCGKESGCIGDDDFNIPALELDPQGPITEAPYQKTFVEECYDYEVTLDSMNNKGPWRDGVGNCSAFTDPAAPLCNPENQAGGFGSAWRGGEFNVSYGFTALQACCGCGGGRRESVGEYFSLTVHGEGFHGRGERISVVDRYATCGSVVANIFSGEVVTQNPRGPASFQNETQLTWHNIRIKRQGIYKICYCSCNTGDPMCCTQGEHFFVEAGSIFLNTSLNKYNGPRETSYQRATDQATSCMDCFSFDRRCIVGGVCQDAVNPFTGRTNQMCMDSNAKVCHATPKPGELHLWEGTVPKDTYRMIHVSTKTRATPPHAASVGPIRFYLYSREGFVFPTYIELSNLQLGTNVSDSVIVNLMETMSVAGVYVVNKGDDAWLCEYIEVTVQHLHTNRFPCDGWSVGWNHGINRLITQDGVAFSPKPQVGMWVSRFFPRDYCGGCPVGFDCVQELMPLRQRIARYFLDRSTPSFQAACRAVCGDGLAAPGEECDDGNIRSLDGCSATCKIENGFECANYHDRPSNCYPRMCDKAVPGTATVHYTQELYDHGGWYGYMVSPSVPLDLQAPVDRGFMCFPWSASVCPPAKDATSLATFQFSPTNGMGRVDTSGSKMLREHLHSNPGGVTCNDTTEFWAPPLGDAGYTSYDQCADQCSMDARCQGAQFFIGTPQGGDMCAPGLTGEQCQARCRLVDRCTGVKATDRGGNMQLPADMYHVGRKVPLTAEELGGDYMCSELSVPRPVWAYESGGVITVQMDSPTQPPHRVGADGRDVLVELGEVFDCAHLLTGPSFESIGGDASMCKWASPDTLLIHLGPLATLGRPRFVDNKSQVYGDASVLLFDSKRLRPRGLVKDFWWDAPDESVDIFVRRDARSHFVNANQPIFPQVIIRGPQVLAGCGPLELTADMSSMGKGRRWKEANWTCMFTQPGPYDLHNELAYSACELVLQPYLNAKPWCGPYIPEVDRRAMQQGVVRPCELRVVIPADRVGWCGLGMIRLRLDLVSADGLKASAEWQTSILHGSLSGRSLASGASTKAVGGRLPTVTPVGSRHVKVSPQRAPGDPLPRIKLEVSTASDIQSLGKCSCNVSNPPADDGSEGTVLVEWYYGERKFGIDPPLYDLKKITTEDESSLMNVLQMPLMGDLVRPDSVWHFVARAAYVVHSDEEGALVTFVVTVDSIKPPSVILEAPLTVCGELCGFFVDASKSQIREILWWSTASSGSSRLLQDSQDGSATNTTSSSTTSTTTRTTASAQSLRFKWECKQVSSAVDDSQEFSMPRDMRGILAGTCELAKSDRLWITPNTFGSEGALAAGLYIFTVEVSDSAYPDIAAKASAMVRVLDQTTLCGPSLGVTLSSGDHVAPYAEVHDTPMVVPPLTHTPAFGTASVTFKELGFGLSCPRVDSVDGSNALLLLRASAGRLRDDLRVVGEIPVSKGMETIAASAAVSAQEARTLSGMAMQNMLIPGFVYAFRLLTAAGDRVDSLQMYKHQLMQAGVNESMRASNRVVSKEPLLRPAGVFVMDTDMFHVHGGPTAGSLNLLEPSVGIGIAMQDTFTFQQLWATDHPPLEYSYYYSSVPEQLLSEFRAVREKGFTDSGTRDRLLALVPDGLVLFSAWARDPMLSTPLPEGMYVIEGRVRDAYGATASRYIAVESLRAYADNATTAPLKLRQLEEYIVKSRQAIQQVRAANRGAVAAVPVAGAIRDLPDLSEFDFVSMVHWISTSKDPSPIDEQQLYGTPVVSKHLRRETIKFMSEILRSLSNIVTTLDENAIRAMKRVDPALRRLDGHEAGTTPHVETITDALKVLSERVAPIHEDELFASIAEIVVTLLRRIRQAGGDLDQNQIAANNFLQTIANCLAVSEAIPLPRSGKIIVNVSEHVQARLSRHINDGIAELGDAIAAFRDRNQLFELNAELPSHAHTNGIGGTVRLTILVRSLDEVITDGVTLSPDLQSVDRWAYPVLNLQGLGWQGFMAQNWAGETDTSDLYRNAICYGASENFLERIVVLMVSWPVSPVHYSTGTLVDVAANVTLPYTLMLRSCGEGIVVDDMPGKIDLVFRLDDATVRDRRYGYKDLTPYRVAWWEDLPGTVGATVDRIRRWTTQGCRTEWSRVEKHMVKARCDRLPDVQSGSIFAIELVARPPYIVQSLPPENTSLHNVVSYIIVILVCRWILLWLLALWMDKHFWPSEHDLVKIHFVPAEFRWKETLSRRGRKKKSKGFLSMEVRELATMRNGHRDEVYECFFDAIAGQQTRPDKRIADIARAAAHMQMEQQRLLELRDKPPRETRLDEPNLEALQDSMSPTQSANMLRDTAYSEAGTGISRKALTDALKLQQELIEGGDLPQSTRTSRRGSRSQSESRRPSRGGWALEDGVDEEDEEEGYDPRQDQPLPKDWEELYHDGAPYYHNRSTGQTSWDRPFVRNDGLVQIGNELARQRPKPRPDGKKLGSLADQALLSAMTSPKQDSRASSRGRSRTMTDPSHNAAPPLLPGEVFRDVDVCREQDPRVRRHLQQDAQHGAMGDDDEDQHGDGGDNGEAVRRQVQMAMEAAARSDETTLPYGWDMCKTEDGREYYVYARDDYVQWHPPILPLHWEERLSSEGRVYYLNLWTKQTQWTWPREESKEMQLALPGHTSQSMQLALELQSNTTADTSVADLVDHYSADALLAMDPEPPMPPDELEGPWAKPEPPAEEQKPKKGVHEIQPWGVNQVEEEWIRIKKNLRDQKEAHDKRHAFAMEFPGIRDFIRPHELADQPHNWEKQAEEVQMKEDLEQRKNMALGHRCELRKADLRQIFPVIQRLQWTKLAAWQMFGNALERASPTWWIYMNLARPTKVHRCVLHLLFDGLLLLCSTPALGVEAPVNEVFEASEVAAWTLFAEIFTTPWDTLPFVCGAFAVGVAHLVRYAVKKGFFAYEVSNKSLITTRQGQQEVMMYFHELAEMGKWVCLVILALCCLGTVALCALLPQPRACIVVRTYLLAVLYSHIALPLVSAIATTVILCMARTGPTFDLLLTGYPDIMDFVSVGVEHPDFLRWRVERTVTEQEQLQLVYSAEWAEEELAHMATEDDQAFLQATNDKPSYTKKIEDFIRSVQNDGLQAAIEKTRASNNKVDPYDVDTGLDSPRSRETAGDDGQPNELF